MKQLFYEGGMLFMSILTLVLVVLIAWAVYHFIPAVIKQSGTANQARARLKHIKTIGSFALVFGIFGQLIGLYEAFSAIQEQGGVSPALLMGGLKISMITTFYGIAIYLFSLLLWLVLDFLASRKEV